MVEIANVLLFALGSSLVGAVTLALIPTIQPDRPRYGSRVAYFLWRYCLPIMFFQELIFVSCSAVFIHDFGQIFCRPK